MRGMHAQEEAAETGRQNVEVSEPSTGHGQIYKMIPRGRIFI